MDLFGVKAKASECRLLAVNARGPSREKYLALADDYDAIDDAIREALLRFEAQANGISSDLLSKARRPLNS